MNKSESKYFNTARLMDQALLALLEKKNYEFITVKEICEKAGVHRSTFYLHYETINDLLAESVEYTVEKMQSKFRSEHLIDRARIETCPLEELVLITPRYLMPYLEFVRECKSVFLAAASQPGVFGTRKIVGRLYDDIFDPILERFGVERQDRRYQMAFYLSGMYAVLREWIGNHCKEDIGYIADLLIRFIHPNGKGDMDEKMENIPSEAPVSAHSGRDPAGDGIDSAAGVLLWE